MLIEDALKHFHHCEYLDQPMTLESLSGAVQISRNAASRLLARLESLGLVRPVDHRWELTTEGRRDALRMVRVHRLFEKYLAEQTGVDEAAWHEEADRREHTLSAEEVEALAARMGDPRFDPHGSPIPTPEGEIGPARGTALATLPVGQHAVIVHVEDEPEAVYAQLVAAGLSVGTRLRMLEAGPRADPRRGPRRRTGARAGRGRQPLDRPRPRRAARGRRPAAGSPSCLWASGPAWSTSRRRVTVRSGGGCWIWAWCRARSSRPSCAVAGGDPTAYLIRGAVIALRKTQADWIRVRCVSETAERVEIVTIGEATVPTPDPQPLNP